MIRRHLIALRLALMLGDGVSAALVFLLVSLIRFNDSEGFWRHLGMDVRVAAILFGIAWVSALWFMGLYQLRIRWSLLTEAKDIARTALLVLVLTLSTLYVLSENGVSRLFISILFLSQPVVTLAGRAIIRQEFGILRRRGYNTRYMLIAGTGTLAQDFADRVEGRPALGIRVIGHLSVPGEPDGVVSRPILGTLDDLGAIFHSEIVDEVAVCLPPTAASWADPIAEIAADEGKIIRVPFDPVGGLLPSARQEEFEGFLVRSLVHDEQHELGLVAKRLIDIVGATVGLVVCSPLLVGTALAIRARAGSPVLFRQTRIGLHGRTFTMYKFRTMVPDAEAQLDGLWAQSQIVGPAIQLAEDSRITPLGSFLRRTSLDELPQLWNVLQGSMSIVGPRPAPMVEVAKYDQWHRRRLSVKPGITGLAQVTIRTYRRFDDRARLDMRYIDAWSIWLDLRIMAKTVAVVLGSTGR